MTAKVKRKDLPKLATRAALLEESEAQISKLLRLLERVADALAHCDLSTEGANDFEEGAAEEAQEAALDAQAVLAEARSLDLI